MKNSSITHCLKMSWVEAKLFLREPVGAFFTLVFPLVMLFLYGGIFGNQPIPGTDGQRTVDILIPALTAMVIGIVGLMSVTITMATYRENGILRRLRTTPVNSLARGSAPSGYGASCNAVLAILANEASMDALIWDRQSS